MYKLIIFGIGNSLNKLEKFINLNAVDILYYCDNNLDKVGSVYNGKKILSPEALVDVEYDFILLAPRGVINRKNIHDQLIKFGINEEKIIDFYDFLNPIEYRLKTLEENTRYETIVTGLSYALHGLNTDYITSKTMMLSFEGQDLYYDYKLLKMVLNKYSKENNFRNVVVCLSYYSFQYDLSKIEINTNRVFMYYNVFHDLHNSRKNPNDYLGKKKKVYELCEKIFLNNFESIVDDLPDNVLTEEQIKINKDLALIDSNKNYPATVEENKRIFNNYLELLKCHNIRPILVVFPVTKYYYEKFSSKLENEFKEIISGYKNIFDFEFYDFFRSDLFDNNDFVDISHLNSNGAKKMGKIIDNIISMK